MASPADGADRTSVSDIDLWELNEDFASQAIYCARELGRRGGRYGIISMCIGGGMGAAALVERA
ncbi:MAG: hypothetical protein JNM83_24360 [Myxococcales bacterium]|nr:hypothetical protein [Myxococcales bacterium]